MDAYQIGRSLYMNRYTQLEVFEAVSLTTSEHVIVKSYSCESLETANGPLSEGLVQSKLEHPNICRLVDIRLSTAGSNVKVHLVMEKLERDVEQEISQRKRESRFYTEYEICDFIQQVGSALAWAKRKGVAHRDIKPENVLLDADGRYKLCDFGASWEKKQQSMTNSPVGTLVYMSPQMRMAWISANNKYNPHKNDVYSLGMTTMHLVLLAVPAALNTLEGLEEKLQYVLSGLRYSERLQQVLRQMLAPQEEQRADIEEVLETLAQEAAPTPTVEIPPHAVVLPEERSPAEEKRQPKAQFLVSVQSQRMALFSTASKTWQKVHLNSAISVNKQSAFLVLPTGNVFCCGGECYAGNYLQTAYVLRQDGVVSQLQQMRVSRSTPGIIYYEDCVFVFGGSECTFHTALNYLKTNEYYSFLKGKWLSLPEMQTPRSSFNPCYYSGRIYLCGGFAVNVEIFDPVGKRFTVLAGVTLPESSNTTAVFDGDKLVIFTRENMCTWSPRQRNFEVKQKEGRGGVWSSSFPVLDEKLYTLPLLWHQTCIGRDISTGRVVDDFPLSS